MHAPTSRAGCRVRCSARATICRPKANFRHESCLGNLFPGGYEDYAGTIAIGAYNQSHHGVVVAAHSIEEHFGETFSKHYIESREDGTTKYISGKHGTLRIGGNVDAAFIPIIVSDVTIGSKVRALNGTVTEVAWGRLADMERLQSLTIYSRSNNEPGKLLFKNTTTFDRFTTLQNIGIGAYEGYPGDSGSAIVNHGGDESAIVGVHQGTICVFESTSEGQPRINILDTEWCGGALSYYKAFSAWENVEDSLNLVRPE